MTEDMWENMILEDMRERREEMEERFKDRY
jgi:hypothetical protein